MRTQLRLPLALATFGLVAALAAPGHTQEPEERSPFLYRLEGQVQDLKAFSRVILAWDGAAVDVLNLELGPMSGSDNRRSLRAELRFEDFQAMSRATMRVSGVWLTSMRPSIEGSPKTPLPSKVDPLTGHYELKFEHLDFGPDAKPDQIAVPRELFCMDGQPVSLEGYMIPVQYQGDGVTEYLLVPHLAACCFGGTPAPDEWVHVLAPKGEPAEYAAYEPIRVRGKLEIPTLHPNKKKDEFEMAYRLFDAVIH